MTWISPQALAQAAVELPWQLLLTATVAMVLALYFWDAVCLPTIYRVDGHRWGYWRSLHLRGLSYLGGAVNYELGQAALAWGMARLQKTGVVRMLARSVLLAYHDVVVLLAVGLFGTLWTDHPQVAHLRPFLAVALAGALALGFVFWALPEGARAALAGKGTASLVYDWNLRRSLRLLPLRVVYFGILVVYAGVALRLCQMSVDGQVVLSTVPLVLLADGLPSVSGLGTRETTLQLLLKPTRPEVLMAMSLFWTVGLLVGRSVIGLAHLWGHQLLAGASAVRPPSDPPS